MGGNRESGEGSVCRRMKGLEDGCGVECVDEEGCATLAWWWMRQKVEYLQARGVGLVGISNVLAPTSSRLQNKYYPYAPVVAHWYMPYPHASDPP